MAYSLLRATALAVTRTTDAIPGTGWVLGLVPPVFVGHLAGRRGFARLSRGSYELALTGTLVAAALFGLLTAVL